MPTYRVELRGDAREVYYVNATDEDDARANWHTGHLELTECYGMDVDTVEEVED